jgi:hypothetical protein
MKRRQFTWTLHQGDRLIAEGVRFAHRSAREAGERALGDHCRSLGITATRLPSFVDWLGSDGRAFAIIVSYVCPHGCPLVIDDVRYHEQWHRDEAKREASV